MRFRFSPSLALTAALAAFTNPIAVADDNNPTGISPITVLHNFLPQANPMDSLVLAPDGVTPFAPAPMQRETIFKISPNGEFTIVTAFTNNSGQHPMTHPVLGADGNLYGTAPKAASERLERFTDLP